MKYACLVIFVDKNTSVYWQECVLLVIKMNKGILWKGVILLDYDRNIAHVVYASDDKFSEILGVSIVSLLYNSKDM